MQNIEVSVLTLAAIVAMAICMAIIPVMMRLAPVIGMLDSPDARKVHSGQIPRVGGIGLVLGIVIPLFIWLRFDPFIISFMFGCLVLLIFGAWDDAKDLSPYIKFLGQFVAVIAVVYYGDVYVRYFPFMGLDVINPVVGKAFTVIALIGIINALNLSDGLDGLAGGEALLSLIGILYVSYMFDGTTASIIAAATVGGIFGFLRFNSHPARVFMGDSGSQALGFILGVLAIYLTQNVNTVVSSALPILLVGLPVLDALVVFYLRARRGDSLVIAAKDHLHHRLLGLGFYHYESVVIIYSVQILLVLSAVLFLYESDILIIGIYIGVGVSLFTIVTVSEKRGWQVHRRDLSEKVSLSNMIRNHRYLSTLPQRVIESGLSLFLIASALTIETVPIDFGLSSVVMVCLLFLVIITGLLGVALYRLLTFVTIGFSVYLLSTYSPQWLHNQTHLVYLFFSILAVTAFISVRLADTDQFRITPLDYLVIAIALIIGLVPGTDTSTTSVIWMAIQIIILFYITELFIQNMKSMFNRLTGVLIATLLLFAVRGLL